MMELITNAWSGWLNFTEHGKIAALLLLALLFFWFGSGQSENKKDGKKTVGSKVIEKKALENRHRTLVSYTTVMAVCCICPLTAAALMAYQTKFYDYQWIWGAVPITIVIALAGTQFWTKLAEKYAGGNCAGWKITGITVLLICVIYLCGRMQSNVWDADETVQNREEAAKVLEILTEDGQNKNICLWAPHEIMEYARALDGSIVLPYGRNMWDGALNAYSYDTYGEEEKLLYTWMCHVEATGEGEAEYKMTAVMEDTEYEMETMTGADALDQPDGADPEDAGETVKTQTITATECMETARGLGVTHILLPSNMQQEIIAEFETYWGIQAENVAGYYLLRIG